MLIISRKKNEKIIIADDIEITILEISGNRVRFGIKAPKHIPIQTRLKTASLPEKGKEVVKMPGSSSSLERPPAAEGIFKRR